MARRAKKFNKISHFATLTILGVLAVAGPCRAGASDDDTPTAQGAGEGTNRARGRDLLLQASAAIDGGSFESARQTLLEAWKLDRSYDVAGALGQTELELARYRDAAEHLDFSLREFPAGENPAAREKIQTAFDSAKKQVASLRISTSPSPDGAEILLDGTTVGRTPLKSPIFVDPGVHRIEATLDGYTSRTNPVQAVAGGEQDVQLSLTKVQTAPSDVVSRPILPRRNYGPAFIAGGAVVTTAAIGIGLMIAAGSKDAQRDDHLALLPEKSPCAQGTTHTSECGTIRNLDDDARTFRTVAYVDFGLTAAAAVLTFFLWPRAHHHSDTNADTGTGFTVLPIIGHGQAALSAHARF